jgi:hypothetical protein
VPTLPPGTGQSVNPAVTPTWIFTPPSASVTTTLQIINTGHYPVYIGPSGVDEPGGMAIPPGSHPLRLQNVQQTLYAISGVVSTGQAATAATGAVTAGTTAITLTATVPTSLAAGTTIIVGNTTGTGWEGQVVASTTASSQITFANGLVNDHVGSSPIYTATMLPGQVSIIAGIL